ncbi:MAG TPA: sugar phosphate isomerase/epimerase family protein [bacterium]|nr:sugar phosphate isomerase/epimerase family protein [bacterium]
MDSPLPLRIGARAHDFGCLPAAELAAKIAAKKMSCVQLAVGKAIAGIDLKPGLLNPGLAYDIGQAFRTHGVQIAVLGCYVNPLYPDPEMRRSLLGLFKEHLRYARDFGNGLVALETGSLNADYSPHPDNQSEAAFQQSLASIAELVTEAEKFGVIVGIEGVASHAVSTPKKMRRMLDVVASDNLQVVFDPVNLLSPENYRQQQAVFNEAFDLYGDRIAIIHAKDFVVEEGRIKTAAMGSGLLRWDLVMKFAVERKPGISILLEETSEDTAEDSVRFLRQVAGAF